MDLWFFFDFFLNRKIYFIGILKLSLMILFVWKRNSQSRLKKQICLIFFMGDIGMLSFMLKFWILPFIPKANFSNLYHPRCNSILVQVTVTVINLLLRKMVQYTHIIYAFPKLSFAGKNLFNEKLLRINSVIVNCLFIVGLNLVEFLLT